MITLNIHDKKSTRNVNYRYVTALMIEARIRGYPLLEDCPEPLPGTGSFWGFMNKIIKWLIETYPDEFQEDKLKEVYKE